MQLTEGCIGIEHDSSQGCFQLMGNGARDGFHGQKPVGALAPLKNEGVGKELH